MGDSFDIVVLGSGIAGATLALVLQQAGLRTLVLERAAHPRFVIGESTLATTTFLFNQLATDYGVPELAHLACYLGLREQGCAAWPQQGVWFGLHQEGRPLEPRHEHMFEALLLPHGPDVHMLRAEADAYLVSRFPRYGVAFEDRAELVDLSPTTSGIDLRVRSGAGERAIRARFVVDATGHASLLARRFGLRDEHPRLHTDTRTLFGHFEGVPALDEVYGGCNPAFRFRRDATTMHHCFRGGWAWVIPFDTGVTSVGFELERERFPLDEAVPPEAELAALLARFPGMQAHLGQMVPVRPLVRGERVQLTSNTILGHRFLLTPHAAASIGPLFSTGIALTLAFISRFVPAAQRAARSGTWDALELRPLEQAFFTEVLQIDRLVHAVLRSFRHPDLFKQLWRNWIIAAVTQLGTCILVGRAPDRPALYGAGVEGFRRHLIEVRELVAGPPGDDLALAAAIKTRTDPWWERLTQPLLTSSGDWSLGARDSIGVQASSRPEVAAAWLERLARALPPVEADVQLRHAQPWLEGAGRKLEAQLARYARSQADGSDFHQAFRRILENHNPNRFDYYQQLGLQR